MAEVPPSHRNCPAGHALALLGDRWSMMIVREVLGGVDRYQDLRDSLGISDNTLTRRLTHLQEIGVLKHGDPEPGAYHLTDAGNDLARVLAVLGDWGMKWLPVDMPLRPISQPVVDAAEAFGFEPSKARSSVAGNVWHPRTD